MSLYVNGSGLLVVSAGSIVSSVGAPIFSFDYYASPTGSSGNAGTVGSPWDINSLNTKQATYAGKKVGLLPGFYPVSIATASYNAPALAVNGGTGVAPTVVGSSDASGVYSARTACIGSHTTNAQITAISLGTTTTVTVNTVSGSNPFTIGQNVAINLCQGTTQINGLFLTVGAIGGVSGAWTFTCLVGVGGAALNSSAFGAYTGNGWASTGYFAGGTNSYSQIGQGASSGVANAGNFTLDGLIVTGGYEYGIVGYAAGSGEGGATGVTIQNCEVWDVAGYENNNVGGILLWQLTGAVVNNCKVHQVIPTSGNVGSQDTSAIFTFKCHSNTYQYNTLYNATCGIYDKNTQNGNHTYQYNYIEMVQTTGNPAAGPYAHYALIDCMGGQSGDVTTVHHNILIANDATWNAVTAGQTLSTCGVLFYNNTCYYVGSPSTGGPLIQSGNAGGISAYNNVAGCSGTQNFWGDMNLVRVNIALSDYNCFITNHVGNAAAGSPTSPSSISLSAWQTASSQDAHSLTGAQVFANAIGLNPTGYVVTSGSSLGAGRVGGVIGGAAIDMGAWGYDPALGGPPLRIGCNFP